MNVSVMEGGQITLPQTLLDTYQIKPGDTLTLVDLGGGKILVSQPRSLVDQLLDNLCANLEADGETLDGLLKRLRTKRNQSRLEPAAA
jgi:bifunctional DNA-binding transcriptional regulator/antitoxin component of YhaV-PrlF toxin-antitoxin module